MASHDFLNYIQGHIHITLVFPSWLIQINRKIVPSYYHPMLFYCWANVGVGGPAVIQHRVNKYKHFLTSSKPDYNRFQSLW